MTDYLQSKAFKSALEQNGVLFKGQQQPVARVGINEDTTQREEMKII